ncbi:NAD-dependent epimerase/dehydratase family protein [Thermodesulfobacteriota bacterium]
MRLNFKKVLVTGGAGFIGSHLVDALVSEGCEVSVIDDLSTGHLSNLEHIKKHITFYQGDILNQELLTNAAKECDIIFHLAAVVFVPQTVDNPVDSAMINEMGTLFVLEAARTNKIKRVVFASSCAVYGDDPIVPKHENMNPKPQSPYALHKLTGEHYARLYHDLYGLETISLRYFNVYGPRQDSSSPYSGVISIFMNKAATKTSPVIYGDGNQYRDFIFINDVVRANLLAANMRRTRGETFNVGTGKYIRIHRLWEMIRRLADLDIEPKYESSRSGDIIESVADIGHIHKTLGFKPGYAVEKGLEITFEWYIDRKNL